jgi:hypothetical protein
MWYELGHIRLAAWQQCVDVNLVYNIPVTVK